MFLDHGIADPKDTSLEGIWRCECDPWRSAVGLGIFRDVTAHDAWEGGGARGPSGADTERPG